MNMKTIYFVAHRNDLQKCYAGRIDVFARAKRFPYNYASARRAR